MAEMNEEELAKFLTGRGYSFSIEYGYMPPEDHKPTEDEIAAIHRLADVFNVGPIFR